MSLLHMLVKTDTLLIDWLKAVTDIEYMLVTEKTIQVPIGWLKAEIALRSVRNMLVTLETFRIHWLKA